MSCCCNNLYYGLPCCCPLYTTTSTTFEPCEDAIICDAAYVTDCVIYNGPTVTFNCLTINPGDDYTEILQGIISNLIQCTTTTTVPPTTTTTTSTTSTTTTSTTTTTTAIPCNCITFTSIDPLYTNESWYTDCNGTYTPISVGPNTTVSYCGCCGGTASPTVVFITTGLPCVNGVCQSTTTTTTIAPEATKCADCLLELDNVTQNAIGVLSVGNLISTAVSPCTIGDYVIDWYLDSTSNPIEFTSGIGSDPAIDQLHPFIGNAARPSIAGNWIPVIRYVFLNGTKYTSAYTPGGGNVYSPDLATCLEPVVVENLNCVNGNISGGDYSHFIQYQAVIQNPADSVRTFRFDLGPTIDYFAWRFYGFTVSDKIEFYYVSGVTQTLLGQYAIGLDVSTNFTGSVKELYSQYFLEVFDLSSIPFIAGDYISISITSSYANPLNQNTNWVLYCKCLETFDCTFGPPAEIDPCSAVMTYDPVACRYELTYDFLSFSDYSGTDSNKYLFYTTTENDKVFQSPTVSNPSASYRFKYGQYIEFVSFNSPTCVNGSLKTLSKTGSVLTISFTDGAEYLIWKNQYLSNYSSLITTYSASTSDVNHFKFLVITYLIDSGLLGCGDNITYKNLIYHISSPVTFDDVNFVMEIDVTNTTNGLTPLCNNSGSNIPEIGAIASLIAEADYGPISSTVRPFSQGYVYYVEATLAENTGTCGFLYQHPLPYTISNYICEGTPNFCVKTYPPNSWTQLEYYLYRHQVVITDVADGVNNYKILSTVDSNGCSLTNPASYITLYEIQNGVVTTPASGCTTTTTAGP